MKKIVLLFIGSILLFSCGGDKKKQVTEEVVVKDNYSVEIEGIYEKDDSITVHYQINNYYMYDNPVNQVVKGSPMPQKINISIPEGVAIENVKLVVSSNKEQAFLDIKNIVIKNNKKIIEGYDKLNYSEYFATDDKFSWDDKNSRFILDHTGENPPTMVGKETLLSLLVK
jgi:uncharacterized protein YcfL